MLECLSQLSTPKPGEDVQTKLGHHSETSGRRCWVSTSGPWPTLAVASFFPGFDQGRAQPLLEFAFLAQGVPTRSNMIEPSLAPLRVTAWFPVCLTQPAARSPCPESSAKPPSHSLFVLTCVPVPHWRCRLKLFTDFIWKHLEVFLKFCSELQYGPAWQAIRGDN